MSKPSFYEALPSFRDFREITAAKHFAPAPADWTLLITDVRGSTRAIEAGRYRDVNLVGAASISVARRAMGGRDFPYVFGGDGATLLIPPDGRDAVLHDLCALRELALANFALDLRVGQVRVGELQAQGKRVDVAKYAVAGSRCLAILRGDGLQAAEHRIKGGDAACEVQMATHAPASLEGLSCRWQPVPSGRGKIVSLLVSAREGSAATYDQVLGKLDEILLGGLEASNPINATRMTYRTMLDCLRQERKCHKSIFTRAFLAAVKDIVGAALVYTWGVPPGFFDPKAYAAALRSHSDFRKFDDILKMVIDCSAAEAAQLRGFLEELRQAGVIYYGLFEAEHSLMTCYVDGLNEGEHIHFIDADKGGYAMAALQLKEQMRAR